MSKLKLFRIIGESFAQAHSEFPMGPIGERKVDLVAMKFFTATGEQLYPKNMHRREWSISNMKLFYEQECERMQIMGRLKGKTTGTDILDMIRQRKAEKDAE